MTRCIPVLLTRDEVRTVRERGELEIRRAVPGRLGDRQVLERFGGRGDRLWVRETFSTRVDGNGLKIRYPGDGAHGQPRFVPIDQVERKYRTEHYFTRPGRFMPRWASRLLLEIVATRIEGQSPRLWAIRHTRLLESAKPAAGDLAAENVARPAVPTDPSPD